MLCLEKRCIIITAYNGNKIRDCVELSANDTIICADGGYLFAEAENVNPDIIIGDFDSMPKPVVPGCKIIELPSMKDDTDTMSCVRYATSICCDEIIIVGGIGGRLDHSLANIQAVAFIHNYGIKCTLTNGNNIIFMLENDKVTLQRKDGWTLSLLAYSRQCKGVCISGVKYPLKNAILNNAFPLGVSNEIVEDSANISVNEGQLLVIQSKIL